MSGHLFVLRGDLTQLACDAVVVPSSSVPEITAGWSSLFAPERLSRGYGSWPRVNVDLPPEWPDPLRVLQMPEAADGRAVWLLRTDAYGRPPIWIADGLRDAVARAAASLRTSTREKPLIGLPLPGVGAGGLDGQRGAIVGEVLPALAAAAAEHDVDVALVLRDPRDHIAVQSTRNDPGRGLLPPEHLAQADVLGRKAAAGDLVLFLGAGVSIGAGMPSWRGLLGELAEEAGLPAGSLDHLSATDAAQIVHDELGGRFTDSMRARFTLRRHSVSHALLAGLGAGSVVTTNYDNGYELAAAGVQPAHAPLRVLPHDAAVSGSPWLLKLHGDAARPESIVLTRDQYLEYGDVRGPLGGMVQALLLTRHMLFVGFSLVDDNFVRLAHQVRRLLATDAVQPRPLGTVLFLRRDELRERLWKQDLEHVAMVERDDEVQTAARLLEVFLDRVAWSAERARGGLERLLLDERYDGLARSPEEERLRDRLRALAGETSDEERRPAAWQTVAKVLQEYGAELR